MTNVLKSLVLGLVVCSLCFAVTTDASAQATKDIEVNRQGDYGQIQFVISGKVPLSATWQGREGRSDEKRVVEIRDDFDLIITEGKLYLGGDEVEVPDYVFKPGHKIESIKDHAKFMWTNKHLPAVPSQQDVAKEGAVDVLGVSMGTLEELEKAHIYIEQLHQRIEKLETLEKRLAALEAQK